LRNRSRSPSSIARKQQNFRELVEDMDVSGKIREFKDAARRFSLLAQNEKWLVVNFRQN
jgi:hypothetical protein